MKNIFRSASMMFLAFMGIAGLGACSSSDDPTDEPTVNPGEAVKTTFTLSVGLPQGNGSNAKAATRVADNIAQVNGEADFRGIDNINLIPFNTAVTANSTRFGGNNITLPNTVANSLTNITKTGNAKVYNDVTIPVGTNHFLFYGKAIDGGNATSSVSEPTDPFAYGYLTVAGLSEGNPSGISFTPKAIFEGEVSANDVATALVAYLNSIAGTSYETTGNAQSTWADYAKDEANNGKSLASLYTNFTSLSAGSSTTAEAAVQELYASLKNLVGDGNLTTDEANLRDAILKNITSSTYVSNGENADANTTLAFQSTINGFPGNINLPDGAASLSFTDGKFVENSAGMTLNNGTQVASLTNFVYPANLWYFANTDIKTSQAALSDQYVDGTAWNDILAKYNEDNSSVNALTRSIALKNQIQYAVGRLQAKVTAAASTLYDRNGDAVNVSAETFPVTAIIIGGQRKVDWQFTPDVSSTAAQYSMYDKAQTGSYATTTGSKANNTLVLETPANEKINIVVELENKSGKSFAGRDGYVPAGGKFYLVAQLDPSKGAQPQGASTSLNQVFKQDYVTVANLTINANSGNDRNQGLGNAYNVIPDLRTPVLSIGMSVNLTWQNGLTFNVDM